MGVGVWARMVVSVKQVARLGHVEGGGHSGSWVVVRGEWWRAFTALTLHADAGHLMANLLFGVLFAYPAAQLVGVGVAWLVWRPLAWGLQRGWLVLGVARALFAGLTQIGWPLARHADCLLSGPRLGDRRGRGPW